MFFLLLVHFNRVDEVYVHFMIAGHTKFSCDRMFGTVAKWLLRGNILKDLSQIEAVLNRNNSNIKAKVMKQKICIDFKKGFGVKTPKVIGVTKYHHFKFSKRNNKVVLEIKKSDGDDWTQISLNYDTSMSNFKLFPKCNLIELSEEMKKGIESLKKDEPYQNWQLESI